MIKGARVIAKTDRAVDVARAANKGKAISTIGWRHHLLSKKIMKALEKHKTLRGIYKQNDPRFIYRAKDLASHRGYQRWHRRVDEEVVEWLERHKHATPEEFERYLHNLYQKPWLRERIPGVNLLE
jgi:hypothetical protein